MKTIRSVLLAVAVVATLLFAAPGASQAQTSHTVVRLAGASRYETAVAISRQYFAGSASEIFLASGETFPDALAIGPMALENRKPLLLVGRDHVPAATIEEIKRLAPTRLTIAGGVNSISSAVEEQLRNVVPNVRRYWGEDRYKTAAVIATQLCNGCGGSGAVPVAYVATGEGFADSLGAARAVAAEVGARKGPLVLTPPDGLRDEAKSVLSAYRPPRIVIAGGRQAVSDHVSNQLVAYGKVARADGADRFETAVEVSRGAFPSASVVFIAGGAGFADGLAAAGASPDVPGPLLLARRDSLPSRVVDELNRLRPAQIVVLGGAASVGPEVEDELRRLANSWNQGAGTSSTTSPSPATTAATTTTVSPTTTTPPSQTTSTTTGTASTTTSVPSSTTSQPTQSTTTSTTVAPTTTTSTASTTTTTRPAPSGTVTVNGPNDTWFSSSQRCRTVSIMLQNQSNTRIVSVDVKFRLQEARADGFGGWNPTNLPTTDDGPYRVAVSYEPGFGGRHDLFICPQVVQNGGASQRWFCEGGCALLASFRWADQ